MISDVQMPQGDGIALLKKIRAHGLKVPLILMTGKADIDSDEALKLGAHCLVRKPFNIFDLIKDIETIIEDKKSESQS